MKKVTIVIETENAAFADDPEMELARIFEKLADRLRMFGHLDHSIRDINGNTVGRIEWDR